MYTTMSKRAWCGAWHLTHRVLSDRVLATCEPPPLLPAQPLPAHRDPCRSHALGLMSCRPHALALCRPWRAGPL
jgi:hypothetical protein